MHCKDMKFFGKTNNFRVIFITLSPLTSHPLTPHPP